MEKLAHVSHQRSMNNILKHHDQFTIHNASDFHTIIRCVWCLHKRPIIHTKISQSLRVQVTLKAHAGSLIFPKQTRHILNSLKTFGIEAEINVSINLIIAVSISTDIEINKPVPAFH